MKYSEDAIEAGFKNQDIELIVPTAFSLFTSYSGIGRWYKIADKAPGIIDLIESTEREPDFFAGGTNPYSALCGMCGVSMGYLGNFKQGEIFLEKGVRAASKIEDLATIGFVELFYGLFFITKGNWKLAIEHLQECMKYCEEVKFLMPLALAQSFLGYAHSHLGDPQTVKGHAEKGLRIHHDSGIERHLSIPQYILMEWRSFKNYR